MPMPNNARKMLIPFTPPQKMREAPLHPKLKYRVIISQKLFRIFFKAPLGADRFLHDHTIVQRKRLTYP